MSNCRGAMACQNTGMANSHPCILKTCQSTIDSSVLDLIPGELDNTCKMVATIAIETSKDEKTLTSSGDVFEGETVLPLLCTVYTLFLNFSFIRSTDTHRTYPFVPHLPDKALVPRDSIYRTDCT